MLLTEILTGSPGTAIAEHALLNRLSQYHQARRTALSFACGTAGVDPTGATAMHEIILAEQQQTPLTPSQLARTLKIATATTTALIDRLVAINLIIRTPHPSDRRKQLLRSRPDALPELQTAKSAATRIAQQLDDHDAAVVSAFLNSISTVLEG